jgi:hypothetical protein
MKMLLSWLIDVAVWMVIVGLGIVGIISWITADQQFLTAEQRTRYMVNGINCIIVAIGILVLRLFTFRQLDAKHGGSPVQSTGSSLRHHRVLRLCFLLSWVVIVLLGLVWVVNPFQVADVALGLFCGEKFFRGRPAHWWLDELDSRGPQSEEASVALKDGGIGALPVLAEVANNHDINARFGRLNAIRTLGSMKTAEAVPILRSLLADDDAEIRQEATAAFGALGPLATAAVPDLYAMLSRPTSEKDERHECRKALQKIAVKAAVQGVFWQQTDPGLEWKALVFSGDSKELMGIRQPRPFLGEIHRWSVTGDPWNVLTLPDWVKTDVALSPDGRLAAVYGSGDLQLWDLTTKQVRTLEDNTGPLPNPYPNASPFLTFSPTGRTLAVADGPTLRLFDVNTGYRMHREKGHFQGLDGYISSVAFSPDSETLVIVTMDTYLHRSADALWLFDIKTGKLLHRLLETEQHQTITTFSPDGKLLATVGIASRQVKVWDVKNCRQIAIIDPQVGGIKAVAFGPDSRALAIGAHDKHISIWDAPKGQKLRELDWHHYPVCAIAFSPDGRTLASADTQGWVKLWDLIER